MRRRRRLRLLAIPAVMFLVASSAIGAPSLARTNPPAIHEARVTASIAWHVCAARSRVVVRVVKAGPFVIGYDALLNRRGTTCWSSFDVRRGPEFCEALGGMLARGAPKAALLVGCLTNWALIKDSLDRGQRQRGCLVIAARGIGIYLTYPNVERDPAHCRA
jgi:hypothetical protein